MNKANSFDCWNTPIFINSRDRLHALRQLIAWLLKAGYRNIFVLDNDSAYPPLLHYYKEITGTVKIIRLEANLGHLALWESGLLDKLNISTPFVYTDPDVVPVENCPYDVVAYFYRVLTKHRWAGKVGFGLKIDDLPDYYRFKRRVLVWESQFWQTPIGPELYKAPIDTTFALYRAFADYPSPAIRTGHPYLARHLPWYGNSREPDEEELFYLDRAKAGVNSWNSSEMSQSLEDNIIDLLNARIDALQSELAEVKGSVAWRLTQTSRSIKKGLRWVWRGLTHMRRGELQELYVNTLRAMRRLLK